MSNFENKPLNTADGWENIVNTNAAQQSVARERVAARKLERKIRKLQMSVCVLSAAALAIVILGAAGAVAGWLATLAGILFLAVGCLQFGRYLEARRK